MDSLNHSMVNLLALHIFLIAVFGQNDFVWNSVKIGGGGGVNGLMQSKDGQIYARTTVGGIYRLNETRKRWEQTMDFIPAKQQNLFGVISSQVSLTNNDTIYMVTGMYEWDDYSCFMKSIDKGKTWSDCILPIDPFFVGSNEGTGRTHDHLKAIPNSDGKSDTLYYGSQLQGLFRSTDSGETWDIVSSFPFKNSTIYYQNNPQTGSAMHVGILWVNVNPFNLKEIYVYLYEYGIYQSSDNGDTWRLIPNSNQTCHASRFNNINDGLAYFACETGLFIYNITKNELIMISPVKGNGYRSIDFSLNGKIMIVSTECRTGSQAWDYNQIYWIELSTVYNKSFEWNPIPMNNTDPTRQLPWQQVNNSPYNPPGWIAGCLWQTICDNRFEDCRRILYGDYWNIWFNDNIYSTDYTSENIWYSQEEGHEEVFVFGLVAMPLNKSKTNQAQSPLISGTADCGGFRHILSTEYPTESYRMLSTSFNGMDFCEKDTQRIVMVSGGEGGDINMTLFISDDNGLTFTMSKTAPPSYNNTGFYGGRIYINPQDCEHFVWIPFQNYPYVTMDGGKTWTKSIGAPVNVSGSIAGWLNNSEWINGNPMHFGNDRKNGNYWYIYDTITSNVYVSNDGGLHFVLKTKLQKFKGDHTFQGGYLQTDFANEGYLCICLGYNGLYCSNDYAQSFQQVNQVYICRMVTFGIGNNKNESVMYIFGLTNSDLNQEKDEGMYIVDNNGYTRMNNDSYQLGDNPRVMTGDRNSYGTVYVGSNGRGLFYSAFV